MGPIYAFLGLTVGVIQHDLEPRAAARGVQLRRHLRHQQRGRLRLPARQHGLAASKTWCSASCNFAIVDEVDSILIDEARTPLIISGQGHDATELYAQVRPDHPAADQGRRLHRRRESARRSDHWRTASRRSRRCSAFTNLYDQRNLELTHQLNAALKAWNLFHKDQQYIVKDGEVIIVDEFTGRLMYGRRYSDGIHQAIEAKEGLKVRSEDQTLATITFQNYFRLYKKLAGMTGTAKTEEREFRDIYGLDVVVIPTNRPVARKDIADIVYKHREREVRGGRRRDHRRAREGPAGAGRHALDREVRAAGDAAAPARRRVQRAQREVSRARSADHQGRRRLRGAVTIATNMAGRGVDIKLGEGVAEIGGLHIIGTERHESRRIDNQLRGRSGRQGDPGSTRFYVALDDELMRLFGAERIQAIMDASSFTDETPIEAGIHHALDRERAAKVENHNYEIRKQVLEYDDVMNKQREVIYAERRTRARGRAAARLHARRRCATRSSNAVDQNAPPRTSIRASGICEAILDELELIFPVKDQHHASKNSRSSIATP